MFALSVLAGAFYAKRCRTDQVVGATVTPRQLLQRPRPRKRGSGLPSPVLKFAWQRMQTYILLLDIIGLTPGSALGRAAVYSACVWRSFGALVAALLLATVSGVVRRVLVMAGSGRGD
jgi:hypothetical protein